VIRRSIIEFQAEKIADPVARLRYLKRHASPEAAWFRAGWQFRKWPLAALAVLLAILLLPGYRVSKSTQRLSPPYPVTRTIAARSDVLPNVWLVDKSADFETYSNGLRIDNRYAIGNDRRVFYPVYKPETIDASQPEFRSEPAGIIYHTTESDQARFEPDQNAELKRIGKQVLSFIRRNHCYHFVISRFGEVFRIVNESDVAYHAGNSVWADDSGIYVNLNSSFLGIAFETQTQRSDELPSANPAQIHAARILTEMLRSKYHIPAADCVTHAQVSVNPANMLMGYHTDWAGNFPFAELGLNDNYAAPPPSIYAFGFDYDPAFVHATGARMWQGLALAEDQLHSESVARGISMRQYRTILRDRYKEILTTLKAASAAKEKDHAT